MRINRGILLAVLISAFVLPSQAEEKGVDKSTDCTPPPHAVLLTPTTYAAFAPGEKLWFDLKYQFVVGGEAMLEVDTGPKVHCRETLRFISNAKSTSFVDSFFKVRDFNASLVDRAS